MARSLAMRIREEVGRRTAVIKSNNPHLRGGEQCLLFELIVELVHNVCKTKGDTRKSVVNFRKWAQTCKSDRSPSKVITLSKHHMSSCVYGMIWAHSHFGCQASPFIFESCPWCQSSACLMLGFCFVTAATFRLPQHGQGVMRSQRISPPVLFLTYAHVRAHGTDTQALSGSMEVISMRDQKM